MMAAKSKMVAVNDNLFLKTNGLLQDDYMNPIPWTLRLGRGSLQANEAKKESCVICFDEDIDFDLMFRVDECGHRFCSNCVKQHIEVKLLETIPNCLEYRCESQLSIDRCGKFLSIEMSFTWKQRIKEKSTPLKERVYCPYQSCSYLMSKTELSSSLKSGLRRCFKCNGSFCLHCKVPWHSTLSCKAYKKLHPSPPNDDDDAKLKSLAKLNGWRQCSKCQHMVERSYGCNHIVCRCGYSFCYLCGAKWDSYSHRCRITWEGNEAPVPFNVADAVFFGLTVVACTFINLTIRDIERTLSQLSKPQRPKPNSVQAFSDFLFAFL